VVGVLGGMGPEATVDFMAKVIALTPIEEEQDHIRLLVDQNPGVPSRQVALLGPGEDPGPVLAAMAAGLEAAGADGEVACIRADEIAAGAPGTVAAAAPSMP